MGSEGCSALTVHVTGFKKFHRVSDNPREAVVTNLKGYMLKNDLPKGLVLDSCNVLDTAGEGALAHLYKILETAVAGHDNESSNPGRVIWLHFGVNSGATKFAIENQAVNEATFCCPDELGWKPQRVPVIPADGGIIRSRECCVWQDLIFDNRLRESEMRHRFSIKGRVYPAILPAENDSLLFTNAKREGLQALMEVLHSFSLASGQLINRANSSFSVAPDCTPARIALLSSITGFTQEAFPFKYLGVLLFKGRVKNEYCHHLIDALQKRLEAWKSRILSFGGKITLIKSVLSSIPIHTLFVLALSKSMQRKLEKMLSTFLWSYQGKSRFTWISWSKACKPTTEGGLGIRNFHLITESVQGKLAWKLLQGDSLWARFMRANYGDPLLPTTTRALAKGSRCWRGIYPHLRRIIPRSRCIIGNGHLSFWYSNWHGRLLTPLPGRQIGISIRDVVLSTLRQTRLARSLLGEIMDCIGGIELSEDPDLLVWTPNPSGHHATWSIESSESFC